MKSLNEIMKQIKGLVYGIRECNYLPYEYRHDIIQESVLKVLEKHNQGVLKDDAKDVRGYVFQIVRNCCLSELKKKDKNVELNFDIPNDDRVIFEEDDIAQHKISLIRANLFNRKFKEVHREYFNHVVDGRNEEEIREIMGLTKMQLGGVKRGLTNKMLTLFKKPLKYKIIDVRTGSLEYVCYSMYDVHRYLPQFTQNQIKYSIEKNRNLNEYKIIKIYQ